MCRSATQCPEAQLDNILGCPPPAEDNASMQDGCLRWTKESKVLEIHSCSLPGSLSGGPAMIPEVPKFF